MLKYSNSLHFLIQNILNGHHRHKAIDFRSVRYFTVRPAKSELVVWDGFKPLSIQAFNAIKPKNAVNGTANCKENSFPSGSKLRNAGIRFYSSEVKKHKEEFSSPTKGDNSVLLPMDFPGYIKPALQDFLLTDLTAKDLRAIAQSLEVDYLGPAAFPASFPAVGTLHGLNNRLMISLVCRRCTNRLVTARNILFLINTGSPVTYIGQEAMEALIGKDNPLPSRLSLQIHSENAIEAHLSPQNSHFANVNVLGMDFLMKNEIFPRVDFKTNWFIIE